MELLLDGTILHDEGIVVTRTGTPNADVEEHLFCLTCLFLLGLIAVGGEGKLGAFSKRAKPEGIISEHFIEVFDELLSRGLR